MKSKLELAGRNIGRILSRNGYVTTLNDDFDLKVTKQKRVKKKKSWWIVLLVAIFFLLISAFLFIIGKTITMIVFLIASLGTLIYENKEEIDRFEHANNLINIEEFEIIIEDKNEKRINLLAEDIKEIEIVISDRFLPHQGQIFLKSENHEAIPLVTLVSDDKRYLEDDLNKIVAFLHLKMFEESEEEES